MELGEAVPGPNPERGGVPGAATGGVDLAGDDQLWAGEVWNHRFSLRDRNSSAVLCDDLDIHVFELEKARKLHLAGSGDRGPLAGWIRFFTEAAEWEVLPKELQRPAMEVAMSTVDKFREDEAATYAYEARQEWLRIQRTQDRELERVRAGWAAERVAREEQQARAEEQQARAEALQARNAEVEAQLRELLARMKLSEN